MKYALKLFWYEAFVYWKLKLLNFRMDSVLIFCILKSLTIGSLQFLYSTASLPKSGLLNAVFTGHISVSLYKLENTLSTPTRI